MEKHVGVYAIKNQITGDQYVGSSIDTHRRWLDHRKRLRRGINYATALQEAWNTYGETAFVFLILESVPRRVELLIREQYYIDLLRPQYNAVPLASTKGKRLPSETIERMRIAQSVRLPITEETRLRMQTSHLGKKPSEQASRRHSETLKQQYRDGRTLSQEARQRIGEAQKNRPSSERLAIAGRRKGYHHTQETIEKIKRTKRENPKPSPNLGKTLSPERIEQLRQTHLGKKVPSESIRKREETKRLKRLGLL